MKTPLKDKTVFLQGKLQGMPRRKAAVLLKKQGAKLVSKLGESVDLVVFGERESRQLDFDELTRDMFEQGTLQIVTEREFLTLLEGTAVNTHSLYTPAMLAELVRTSPNMIRLWERRGLLHAVAHVGNLAYYDETEILAARRLTQLTKNHVSLDAAARKIESLKLLFPETARPLAELDLFIDGKSLRIFKDSVFIDSAGQKLFSFDEEPLESVISEAEPSSFFDQALGETLPSDDAELPTGKKPLCDLAVRKEEQGDIAGALDCYRAALAAGGPDAVSCFQMAGLLYQLGELPAARERYLMTIELDENFVEARAALGALFAEMGETELAVSAFEGALDFHEGYADVHFQLGMLLHQLGRTDESREHLRLFLELA
ncbi:MAG: MerR family transcriptional regulator, partial [Planctomycetaceae bacterium]|nr:MerR family transcriptional regulator [Planctomycetaceae bacterium]